MTPLHFEDAPGVPSRFERLLTALSGDVFAPPLVVATRDCATVATRQAQCVAGSSLILEPEQHKPAAAVLSALMALRDRPHALVVVAPASADFADAQQLDTALCHAIPAAQRGEIVMLGQRRSRAYMGHGLFEVASAPRSSAPVSVDRVLTSDRQPMLSGLFHGNHHLCGLGIYVARVDTLLAAYKRHASRIFLAVKNAAQRASRIGEATLLEDRTYRRIKTLSFERAVAQKADNLVAVQLDVNWSVHADWDRDRDAERHSGGQDLSAWEADLAAERQAAGAHPHAADMMSVYASLAEAEAGDALSAHSAEHDWGRKETLAMGPGFSLQRLLVNPGESVELCAGDGVAEHWVVVQGAALITLGNHVRLVWESQSARVPAGRSRRIENPGSAPLQLIQLHVSALPETAHVADRAGIVPPAGVA
ncbi:mannose-6-phosphate isomerase [Epibacterium sp. Ofav1-8]|uniref:mannose-6-phosphate isomerase n=1 Tax=Epibacterium sp. Ofav1-8 TaxID=2917735 RepID=UPI001EF5026C|nr:mannose-6-phosphate isomerase [Epibacterium sp. Ofav1-8]MCG7623381.1 mannose-6-phosphate isomerase [Epibacterium sp. Ofav1-8]